MYYMYYILGDTRYVCHGLLHRSHIDAIVKLAVLPVFPRGEPLRRTILILQDSMQNAVTVNNKVTISGFLPYKLKS